MTIKQDYSHKVRVNMSEANLKKMAKGVENGTAVKLKIAPDEWNEGEILTLTKTQFGKVDRAIQADKTITITLTNDQLEAQRGGSIFGLITKFLPQIIKVAKTVLPTLALSAVSGALSGATSKGVSNAIPKTGGRSFLKPETIFMTQPQEKKLVKAIQSGSGIRMKIKRDPSGKSDKKLLLTKRQYNKLMKKDEAMLDLSNNQLRDN